MVRGEVYRAPVNVEIVAPSITPLRYEGYRALLIVNNTGQTVYPAIYAEEHDESWHTLGNWFSRWEIDPTTGKRRLVVDGSLQDLTGWELPNGQAGLLYMPLKTSGRVWVRNNCRWMKRPDGTLATKGDAPAVLSPCTGPLPGCGLVCDTGNCGAGPGLVGYFGCSDISGESPCSVFEFTLAAEQGGEDVFDLSLIDGYNFGISVTPLGATRADSYEGSSSITMQLDRRPEEACPAELRWFGSDGQAFCNSVGKAALTPQHREQIRSAPARVHLERLMQETLPENGNSMIDQLSCRCPSGASCSEAPDGACCSPYVDDYPETEQMMKKRCLALRNRRDPTGVVTGTRSSYGMSNAEIRASNALTGSDREDMTQLPYWPKASDGSEYYDYFVPDRFRKAGKMPPWYIWQFGDHAGLFHATGATGYRIEFLKQTP